MGDGDTPKNPADKQYKDAPEGLRAFLNCTSDSYTLTDGEARWIPGWPKLSIRPLEGSSAAIVGLDVTFNNDGYGVGFTVVDGVLTLTLGGLAKDPTVADTARWFKSFVENANTWLHANGKDFGQPVVTKGRLTFTKRDIVRREKDGPQPGVVVPPLPGGSNPGGPTTADGKTSPDKAAEAKPADGKADDRASDPAPGDTKDTPPTLPPREDPNQQKRTSGPVVMGAPGAPAGDGPSEADPSVTLVSYEAPGYSLSAPAPKAALQARPDLIQALLNPGFLIALAAVALIGTLAGSLVGNAGVLTGAAAPTPSHRPGFLESPTPGASGPEASGAGASGEPGASAAPGPSQGPGSSPAPTAGVDLSKIGWTMYLQAGSDQVDFHCRIKVRANVHFQANGSSGEEDQALIDAVTGMTAIVHVDGPGLPSQVSVKIAVQGDNYTDVGDITVATAGASYQETLVSVGGMPLNLKSQVFVNPCTN